MNASVLLDVAWAMAGGDVAIIAGAIGSAMWINRRDNKRSDALWAAYLAGHPELAARLGVKVGSRAATREPRGAQVMTGRLPAYAGEAMNGAGGASVAAAVGDGGLNGGAEEQVHG